MAVRGICCQEHEGVGQPVPGEARLQEITELLLGGRGPLLDHHASHRSLAPASVRHCHHRGLLHGRMPHERVLQVYRADPLAAGLDEVLGTVGDANVPLWIDGHDVTGPEPAVHGELVRLGGVLEVALRDPRAPDLQLAHRDSVPRRRPGLPDDPCLHEGQRQALARPQPVLLRVRSRRLLWLEAAHRPDGRHLGHAPGVDHLEVVPLLEGLDHGLRSCRSPHHHGLQRGDVPAGRVLVESLEDSKPHGGNARREGHLLALDELEQARGVQVRAGKYLLGADHGRGEGQPPGVDVEHGDDRHHDVRLRQPQRVGHRASERVEHESPMGIHDALRPPRRPGGVADPGRLPLCDPRKGEGRHLRLDELLVVDHPVRRRVTVRPDDDLVGVHLLVKTLVDRHEHVVDHQEAVLGVVHDVGEVLGRQPRVEGVDDSSRQRNGEVRLEVTSVVPGERRDPIAGPQAHPRERVRELLHALVELAVGGAVNGLVRPARDDLGPRIVAPGALEQRVQRQVVVHHLAVHDSSGATRG